MNLNPNPERLRDRSILPVTVIVLIKLIRAWKVCNRSLMCQQPIWLRDLKFQNHLWNLSSSQSLLIKLPQLPHLTLSTLKLPQKNLHQTTSLDTHARTVVVNSLEMHLIDTLKSVKKYSLRREKYSIQDHRELLMLKWCQMLEKDKESNRFRLKVKLVWDLEEWLKENRLQCNLNGKHKASNLDKCSKQTE